jgi:hypothetical protein
MFLNWIELKWAFSLCLAVFTCMFTLWFVAKCYISKSTISRKHTNVDDWPVWFDNMFEREYLATSNFKLKHKILFVSWFDCW